MTPAEVQIHRQALTVLRDVLLQPAPCEGCALLIGRRFPDRAEAAGPARRLWRLERIWPCLNVWEPAHERTRRFQLDPREQLLAQRWARRRHQEVLGAAHSHPCGAPIPSPTDLAFTAGPTLMLILGSAANSANGALGCWWLGDQADGSGLRFTPPIPLLWRMVD